MSESSRVSPLFGRIATSHKDAKDPTLSAVADSAPLVSGRLASAGQHAYQRQSVREPRYPSAAAPAHTGAVTTFRRLRAVPDVGTASPHLAARRNRR